jgi:hypothetical protein
LSLLRAFPIPTVALAGFVLALGAASNELTHASASGVVVSAVYGGGGNAGSTYTHDFVELFNAGSAPVSLSGWSVQYASATGTFNAGGDTPLPAVTLQPGQYFLIQQAVGTGGTTPLPTPDATDTTAMSGTAGKVALVSNATLITGLGDPDVVDFVGYGTTANAFEGSGPTPAPNNANAVFRAVAGCTDADDNSTDFTASAAFPNARNSATPAAPCGGSDNAPTVSITSPADGAQGIATGANLVITFSEPVAVAGSWFGIQCSVSGTHSAVVSGGPSTFTLDPDLDFAGGEACTVTVFAAQVADLDANDPPDTMAADFLFDFETATGCGSPAVAIHDIQGNGAASPLVGQSVTLEGVVVGDFQGTTGLGGFFVQEEDADADALASTSEGIFVFQGAFAASVAPGDRVRVSGGVVEFSGLTELTGVTSIVVCAAGQAVTPASVSLPFASATDAERFEGMAVVLPQSLTVTEVFNLGRFGEVLLSSGGRLFNPTNVVAPGAPAAAQQALNDLNRLVLDDGSNVQNPDPTPFAFDDPGTAALDPTLRLGHTVAGLQGVMHFAFGSYRIQPVAAPAFLAANPRPLARPDVGGDLKVAAVNVLNYFNGDGAGGGFPTSRGANSAAEFARQRAKTVANLLLLDADVAGLMEMENDSTAAELAAVEDLVDGLNAAAGAGSYAFVDTDVIGTDEIRVALLYKPSAVTPVGTTAVLLIGTFAGFSRPPIAQAFEDNASGERFIVVVNHFKSKSCGGATGLDLDQGDGQGCFNAKRVQSAQELLAWLATDPTGTADPDLMIIGDLNSYLKEDPIATLQAGGYTSGVETFIGDEAYSFVFSGQSGALDHAMLSGSMATLVTGMAELHANADEPGVLDYNLEFKSAAQQALEVGTPYRAADHDALLVGLRLQPAEAGLENGGLEIDDNSDSVPDGWTGSGLLLQLGLDGQDCTVAHTGSCSFRFRGGLRQKRLAQTVALAGERGDVLDLAYWVKTLGVTPLVLGRAQVIFQRADGGSRAIGVALPFGTRDWTRYSFRARAPHDYVNVRVEFISHRLLGRTWIDDVELLRE